jgi:hypothetical protein
MPRPTLAQLAYGTATVVCATLAMLLLSHARSLPAVLAVTVTALGLGLLVALALPRARRRAAAPQPPAPAVPTPRPADRVRTPHASLYR